MKIISKCCCVCKNQHLLSFSRKKTSSSISYKISERILENEFICFSDETVFEVSLLKRFTSSLLFNHASFSGFVESLNYLYNTKQVYNDNKSRNVLIESRLTEHWFYYRYIMFYLEINKNFSNFKFFLIKDLDLNLLKIKPELSPYFIKKWNGIKIHFNLYYISTFIDYNHLIGISHLEECIDVNCSVALCVDGLHKVNRMKCVFENKSFSVEEIGLIFLISLYNIRQKLIRILVFF